MRAILFAAACIALAGGAQAASPAATPPNIVGTWTPTGQTAVARQGSAFGGWNNAPEPKFQLDRPTVVIEKQDGRSFAGYKLLADGSKDRFVGVFRHNGKDLVTSADNGQISGEIFGDEMEWCFTDTMPAFNVAGCDMLQKAATK